MEWCGVLLMNRKTIAIRLKVGKSDADNANAAIVGVTEAASRLGVSERTIYRLLKSGELERIDKSDENMLSEIHVRHLSDISTGKAESRSDALKNMSDKSDEIYFRKSDIASINDIELLKQQLGAKDTQIAQLLLTQQEMTQTLQRLQEQMYELAHLVLTHNVAVAQAKADAELKLQAKDASSERRGWTGLLGKHSK